MIELMDPLPGLEDPLAMLRSCHRRVERALAALRRITEREQERALEPEECEALRQALDYFAVSLPRHVADEEQSLFPRLRERDPAALAAVERLEAEHRAADVAHAELDRLGRTLAVTGRFWALDQRERFAELLDTLTALYREHIRIEDDELIPQAGQVLATDEIEALGREMAARRGIDWDAQLARTAALRK